MPSAMPVAIASTFLTAPPTSTPTGSVDGVDAQRSRRGRRRPQRRATPASLLAATSAVGWPRATSIAKLGPESTPTRADGAHRARDLVAERAGRLLEALAQPEHGGVECRRQAREQRLERRPSAWR